MSRRDRQILYVDANGGKVLAHGHSAAPGGGGEGDGAGRLLRIGNHAEALAYLRGEGAYRQRRRPDLIVLDLPAAECPVVLGQIKADEALRRIPVIVLGGAADREEVLRAYDGYANCYVARPGSAEELRRLLSQMEDFWFNIAKLPGA